ncbi:hypothetical protein BMS3Bbin01_02798 [bacterium BMS3Bbin01]|nr:hypothetical protein BMS3Bbin01_02798 [bacterium BMS3Bbin01]
MDVGQVEGAGGGHRGEIHIREHLAGVGTLVARHPHLGNHGVDHPRIVGLPWVRSTPQHNHPGSLHPAIPVEGMQHAGHAGRVARHHPSEPTPDSTVVVDLGDERIAGEVVGFTTLQDRLHARLLIDGLIGGPDPLGGAVDDHIHLAQQVGQGSDDGNAAGFHLRASIGK